MKGYSLKQRLLSKITIETELINEILQQLENHYQNGESTTVTLHQIDMTYFPPNSYLDK